jgi:hypothetical protein
MNTRSLLVLAALMLAPAVASAQRGGGYYNNQPNAQSPGGFHNRTGRLIFGVNLGLGGMSDRGGDIECSGCDYSPLAGEGGGHIGGFLGPRFALMAELQVNVQTLTSDRFNGDTTSLVQSALMVAGQYFITPQLWIKGGIGFANIQVERSYYGDGIIDAASAPESGGAILGAVGYEVLSSRLFSVDLQGRLLNGSYKGIDNNVTAASVGVGINWF